MQESCRESGGPNRDWKVSRSLQIPFCVSRAGPHCVRKLIGPGLDMERAVQLAPKDDHNLFTACMRSHY